MNEGKPVVFLSKEENYMLAETCKLTVIGKYTKICLLIKKIRDEFKTSILLKGDRSLQHASYVLDYTFEEDHRNVHGRNFLTLYNIER